MNKQFFLLIFLMAAGCSPALYKPLPEHAVAPVTLEQLQAGRKLYVNTCGSCHSLYMPDRFPMQVWVKNVDEMQERAKISDAEKELILTYLSSSPGKKQANRIRQ